jgi:GntR family transcriptional regulator
MSLPVGVLRHQHVARAIADQINAGRLRPGDRLPSERQLCERFDVSRATVRRALQDLIAEGLVEAQQGRGSFVAGGPLGEPPNTLSSFTEMGTQRGLRASARVLRAEVAPAGLDEAEAFGIAPGSSVFVLERLRLLDGHAVSVDRSRVPLARAPGLVEVDFSSASLYAVMDAAGAGPRRAEYALQAVAADPTRAALLGVDPGFPLLHTATRSYDAANSVVELGDMHYRGDRYRFRTTLTRRPEDPGA